MVGDLTRRELYELLGSDIRGSAADDRAGIFERSESDGGRSDAADGGGGVPTFRRNPGRDHGGAAGRGRYAYGNACESCGVLAHRNPDWLRALFRAGMGRGGRVDG